MDIKFFCINLENRLDRWENCQKQFEEQNIYVTRWNATPLPDNRRFGAWLSHREIIEKAKIHDWNCVGVFEDDIKFLTKNFAEECENALEQLRNVDWHILYFGGLIWTWWSLQKKNSLKNLLQVNNFFEAHAVIYNKTFFDIYLDKHPSKYSSQVHELYLDNKYSAFDQWFAGSVQSKYPCYITNKILVGQQDDFSNIENKIVARLGKSIYRFYIYKYLWTRISTFLEINWSRIKKFLKNVKNVR